MPVSSSSSSSSFCTGELQQALKEQAFGIKSFAMASSSSSPHQATACIVLLEGQKIVIQLTTQGYSVVSSPSTGAGARVYETIEDLLQSASPLYVKKRQDTLLAALSKLS